METRDAAATFRYAGWWSRVGALLLDSLILAIPSGIGVALLFAAGASDDPNDALAVVAFVVIALAVLAPFVYFPFMHSREHGQTWGKRAAGIRVRRSDGGRLTGGRSFARYAVQVVFGLFYLPILLDYLWPLWDSRNQSLHDKVVDSVVVRA